MTRRLVTLPGFNGVAAGQTATLDLPATETYARLGISYTKAGAAAAEADFGTDLTELRFRVNGKVQRRLSAEEIIDLNKMHGKPFTAGFLPVFFAEPWRRTTQGEDALAWGMGDVSTFQLEVDLASGIVGSVALSAKAVKIPVVQPMGAIVKWRKFTVPVTATGIVTVSTLPKSDAYYGLHMKTANISDVRVMVDNREVVNGTRGELHDLLDDVDFVADAGYTHVLFDATRRVGDALAMKRADGSLVQDFRVDLTMSAATTHTMITEVLGLRD